VPVFAAEPEALSGLPLGVELDQHRGLVALDPGIVTGFEDDGRRRRELEGAAVPVLPADMSAGQEANVGVHALPGAHDRSQVGGPPEPRRVHDPLDTDVSGADEIDRDPADLAVVGSGDRCEQWIHRDLATDVAGRVR
jgi:hypothetical protein